MPSDDLRLEKCDRACEERYRRDGRLLVGCQTAWRSRGAIGKPLSNRAGSSRCSSYEYYYRYPNGCRHKRSSNLANRTEKEKRQARQEEYGSRAGVFLSAQAALGQDNEEDYGNRI